MSKTKSQTPPSIELLKEVNIHSSVAVYVQIENEVQFAIASGRLKPGDQLPSVRELSERLDINPNTVAKSYRDLEVMGYLYTRRGMGVFIKDGVQSQCRDHCRLRAVERLHEVIAEAKAAGIGESDVKEVMQKCLKLDASPYGVPPNDLFTLIAGKSKSK